MSDASSSAEYDAFLTHDWGDDELGRSNHARVAEVNRLLKAAGFVTWFDEDRMQGDIVSQMANGIDSSAAVLVFVTENYCIKVAGAGRNGADDNCKKEFDYASRRKGIEKMIAAVMEPRCRDPTKWQGAVGMTLGGRLYKDLAEDDVAAAVPALMEEIVRVTGRRPTLRSAPLSRRRGNSTPLPALQLGLPGSRRGSGDSDPGDSAPPSAQASAFRRHSASDSFSPDQLYEDAKHAWDQKEFAQALEFFEAVEELLQVQQKNPATWHGGNLQRYLGETRKALELERKGFKTPESPNAQKIAEFLKKVSIDGLEVDEPVTSPLRNSDANKYGQLLHEAKWHSDQIEHLTVDQVDLITKDADMPSPHRELLLSAARRRQSVRATVHAVSAVNYLSAAARRTKLLALAAKLRSWRRATRLALAVIVALAALVAALYSPLQAYV